MDGRRCRRPRPRYRRAGFAFRGGATIFTASASSSAPRRQDVLNRFDPRSPAEAEVKYLDGDFRVLRPGAFVRCAVTGVPIPLEELKYWSVERQEAYASPEAVLTRMYPGRVKRASRDP